MRASRTATLLALCAAALAAGPVAAQPSRRPTLEMRPFVGGYVPGGGLRDAMGPTLLYGGQGALAMSPATSVVGSFALARPHDRLDPGRRRVLLAQVDVGLERARSRALSKEWALEPFLGAGLGARSYTFSEESGEGDRVRSHLAGYGAIGVELRSGRLGLRAEGRGYLASFSGLRTDARSAVRADATLAVGVAYHLR